jgi:tetratricopeptide (TPR) repeat protein
MPEYNSKNCFVIIGYGPKTAYPSGRVLDLDKSFDILIKPVFDDLGIKCFRSKDLKQSGMIDTTMYEWIYKADIVVADISTLNANALYELGVRHALKPHTTIIIGEDQIVYPFDINHISMMSYRHLGEDIGASTAKDFTKKLKEKVEEVLQNIRVDSPVYEFLRELKPPEYVLKEIEKAIQKAAPIESPKDNSLTLSELINIAEDARKDGEFKTAKKNYQKALELDPNNPFLIQRMALATYKSKQPDAETALRDAEKILAPLSPDTITDPETLGLSGAINKRLYDITKDETYLRKAIRFYERGFYIKQDYYNGINVAYLYNVAASVATDKKQALALYYHAKMIREEVIELCNALITSENFNERGDGQWIYQTLAEAYKGIGDQQNYTATMNTLKQVYFKDQSATDSFAEQMKNLEPLLKEPTL